MKLKVVPPNPAYARMRRWPRYSVDLPIRVYSDIPRIVCEARGKDLNRGGMTLSSTVALAAGEQIFVEFLPPGAQQSVSARCVIRNRSSEGCGVEFIAENDTDYRTIGEIEYALNKFAARLD